ncbi:MAG: gliding motility-associated C-terminal domain-containing protein [Bacteroidales bacterium]|nr:gliding motility-associated C-terminal domain-containing protein [Bacteroidales bacterium]
MKKILIYFLLFFCTLSYLQTFSQPNKRTNFWYFGENAGLDFNSGQPIITNYGQFFDNTNGGASICDTAGNLLFYTDGKQIWDRDHYQMKNGFVDFHPGTQAAVIVPLPGSDNIYYVFTSQSNDYQYQFFYYIVDMSLANGLGEVVETVTLQEGWDAAEKLTAVYHKNKQDIWVITRKFIDDNYAAFLVTSDGVNPTPVLSPAPDKDLNMGTNTIGCMKVSYDKKYLITSYFGGYSIPEMDNEICSFNNETGQVDFLYSFSLHIVIPVGPSGHRTFGFDFSPDSKYLYLPGIVQVDNISHVFQFNMQYIEDSLLFFQSAIEVGIGQGMSLQLASDGKIYCSTKYIAPPSQFMGVIHKPWREGIDCEYEPNSINLLDKIVTASLPNFLTDYLFRFDFDGICESDTFSFDPWFFPEPVFIEWDFGDPASGANNTSTIPHATHVFSDGGTYEVSVHVEYPSGRIEETSRKVEVEYSPEPNLGPDTTICTGADIILNAECGQHFYLWSNGAIGSSQITVSDTGWYWVRVTSSAGCFEFDSIYIEHFPPAIADTNNLIISPTTCGGSIGAIRGIVISGNPPFIYQWLDDLGNPIANTIDIFHLAVGNYTLQIIDGNDCLTEFGPYLIYDAGDVLIEDVNFTQEHCGQQDGKIIVTATSGLGDMLFYSIDNGANYFTNQGIFTGLSAGTYAVRVQDSTQCEDVFINNPIILENIPGPQITDVQITSASIGMNNGAINIFASGNGDTIFYSNDNGVNFQINDGLFSNLFAGFYTCIVMDNFGCDTIFIVEVTEEITVYLEATAGADEVCPGNSAFVPLIVSNFNDVGSFKATLLYNKDLLTCVGFANAHPQLVDSLEALLFPAEGRIELNWTSSAVTLPDSTNIADLVFQSIDPGTSFVEWNGSTGASLFLNSTGLTIPVDYTTGNVKIYKDVSFLMFGANEVCEGETLELSPLVFSSNGDVTFLWTDPNGNTSTNEIMTINNIQNNQSGIYLLTLTDTLDCQADTTVDVIVYPSPSPAFAGQNTIITEENFDLDAGSGFLYYLWNTGDSTQIITINNDGWYSVEIESQEGCFGEDSVFVLFEPIRIFLPNAFTPGSNGLNDEFKVLTYLENIEYFKMLIYNRWGALIFQSNDISHGWDGKYKGKLCPQGTYIYKIQYSLSASPSNQSETKMGTVVLVR